MGPEQRRTKPDYLEIKPHIQLKFQKCMSIGWVLFKVKEPANGIKRRPTALGISLQYFLIKSISRVDEAWGKIVWAAPLKL